MENSNSKSGSLEPSGFEPPGSKPLEAKQPSQKGGRPPNNDDHELAKIAVAFADDLGGLPTLEAVMTAGNTSKVRAGKAIVHGQALEQIQLPHETCFRLAKIYSAFEALAKQQVIHAADDMIAQALDRATQSEMAAMEAREHVEKALGEVELQQIENRLADKQIKRLQGSTDALASENALLKAKADKFEALCTEQSNIIQQLIAQRGNPENNTAA